MNSYDESNSEQEDQQHDEQIEAKYTIGICAMDKKARSKPMNEIVSRLPRDLFRVILFGDHTILHEPIESWPQCNALIAFFSTGFPLEKAKAYVKLRNPVVVNDLDKQDLLHDRRDVYRLLMANNIPVPRHVFMSRDGYNPEGGLNPPPVSTMIEGDDFIEVDGIRITKPFVEKPVDGENHNVYIYYPTNAGGGCKRLFRKVGNRSSEFIPNVTSVRKVGSYIYEEFLSTQGTDVKVYTVGPNYAHAEARKSPVLDGRVLRDSDGKEVRYPVILSPKEKEIAYNVCRAFGQTICGFDILRVHDASYVCDVNGWSFVKNSEKYYDDCAILLSNYIEQKLIGPKTNQDSFPSLTCSSEEYNQETNGNDEIYQEEELRCVLAVIRHGDRTPKQKMKMKVCHPAFLQYYKEKRGNLKDLKIKTILDLEHLLQVSRTLIQLYETNDPTFQSFLIERETIYGEDANDRIKGYRTLRDVLERWQLCGINRKVQLKPTQTMMINQTLHVNQLLLIVKWGGDLTHIGMEQAERLGQRFRQSMYPGGQGGLIRLHSTYRHDLKIYTSEEGRVQKTAASFAKGLLELEGDIIPILVGLVLKSKDADSMLDPSGSYAQEIILRVKQRLHTMIHRGDNCMELMDSSSRLIRSVAQALTVVDQPIKKMETMYKLLELLQQYLSQNVFYDIKPCGRETLEMMRKRWMKLYHDFYSKKTNTYDLSKIPDIYDCIRYDVIHNTHMNLPHVSSLLSIASSLAHVLVPQEYGMNEHEKYYIGAAMCRTLLIKIKDDLKLARGSLAHRLNPHYATNKHEIKSTHRSVRTRLYFTSESHLHTLLNVLRTNKKQSPMSEEAKKWVEEIPELCYMTHFVVRVFERLNKTMTDPQRFRVEITFSPGADQDFTTRTDPLQVSLPRIISRDGLTCQQLVEYFEQVIQDVEQQNHKNNQELNEETMSRTSSNSSICSTKQRSGYLLSTTSSISEPEETLE